MPTESRAPAARLLAFYRGEGVDDRGRRLEAILEQDDAWLERTHDFIQWLFPLREPSLVTPEAPLVDAEVAAAFAAEPRLRQRLRASLDRMLGFYGLAWQAGQIAPSASWAAAQARWFSRPTHNDLRITRILKSCVALGLAGEAGELLDALERLARQEPGCGVTAASRAHWRSALGETPSAAP